MIVLVIVGRMSIMDFTNLINVDVHVVGITTPNQSVTMSRKRGPWE